MDLSGQVFCWGENRFGQLGYGDREDRGGPPPSPQVADEWPRVELAGKAKQVTVGARHSCALMDSGAVKCWGGSVFGILGYGDAQDRGFAPGHMGDNLPAVERGGFAEAGARGEKRHAQTTPPLARGALFSFLMVVLGPSRFDLSVCGRPPAASEGVGPPSLKTKTSRSKTAKISLRERHCAPR